MKKQDAYKYQVINFTRQKYIYIGNDKTFFEYIKKIEEGQKFKTNKTHPFFEKYPHYKVKFL